MNLNALKVDPEFQGKIPPLTFEELNQLEANILRDGRIINPIIVWEGLIVDGHNRFIIAKKHPEIPFTVHETEFANRYEAAQSHPGTEEVPHWETIRSREVKPWR